MSSNHVDIFMTAQDDVSIEEGNHGCAIKLGGTAKIFLLSTNFTIDQFMVKLNETYQQASARKESKDGGKTDKGSSRERKVKT